MMQFTSKEFNQLQPSEIYRIYRLRAQVFVVEQKCAYLDVDEKDLVSWHVLMQHNDELAGYSRIVPPGVSYREPSIGRVVVDPGFRGMGAGKELMKQALKKTRELYEGQDVVISAQTYLVKFYTDLGFKIEGPEYLEDNIPHIKMRKLKH
jgi:ElaA protein